MTKVDLVPHLEYEVETAIENARSINPELEVFTTSSRTGEGLEAWTGWLAEQVSAQRQSVRGAGS
jgi:hydrogenase nickel incorporation protein HypB